MKVRGLFRCDSRTETAWGGKSYKFVAVYDTTTEEHRRFAQATPSGELTIVVTNPDVSFELGKNYYLDLSPEVTEAPEPAA